MKRAAAGAMPPLPWLSLGLLLAGTLLAGCSTGPAIDGGTPSAASSAAEDAAAPDAAAADSGAVDTGERLAALLGNTGGPADVVLLGDSFAAGEGAGSYQPVDGVADSLCHRSAAGLLSAAGNSTVIHNAACSRARISALGSAQPMQGHGNAGVPAQLDQLRGVRPDLVLLYIGGNDAGFAELLQACIVEDTSCAGDAGLRQATKQTLRDLRAPLTRLYTELGASGAPVLVLPYPRLFDAAPNPGQDACGRLTPEELSFGLDITDALNSTIEQSVAAARLPNVRYVDALEGSFAGRGACSADPLVVTARLGPLLNAAASVSAAQEVLHPTEEGYRVLTGDLLQWMEDNPS